MPLTITGSLADPRRFAEIVVRDGRRATSIRLRQVGLQASLLALQLTDSELGPSRVGNRRRDRGVSYRNGWQPALYSGLEEFDSGDFKITLSNRSRHARVLEVGASPHPIPVGEKGVLAWPKPFHVPGKIAVLTRKTVDHPGFTGRRIMQRAATGAMTQSFVGQTLGHARIVIRSGRR